MPDTLRVRRQLTLYVPSDKATELEAVRRIVDPMQSGLIAAHVTMCREDEIDQSSIPELRDRLTNGGLAPIALHFGRPTAFSGHGILLACVGGEDDYQALRRQALGRPDIRALQPHITLAHPRNPKAPGNSLATAASLPAGMSFTFDAICLIEQQGRKPWRLLERFPLLGPT